MNDNANLIKALEEGETIRWSGAPQPYGLFDESRKTSTLISLGWALAWGIILVGGYCALVASSKSAELMKGVIIFLVAVSILIALMPLFDKNKIKKLLYAVTDKKVIIASQGDNKLFTMLIADIDELRIDEAGNGNCHIRMGASAFKTSIRKLPLLALRGESVSQDNKEIFKGLVFFNVSPEDGKAIGRLLKPAIPPA